MVVKHEEGFVQSRQWVVPSARLGIDQSQRFRAVKIPGLQTLEGTLEIEHQRLVLSSTHKALIADSAHDSGSISQQGLQSQSAGNGIGIGIVMGHDQDA
jgi:hypothetical protein